MAKDQQKYLEDAIKRLELQISNMRSKGMIDPRIIDHLRNQKLQFEEDLAKIVKHKGSAGPSIFTLMDEFDDEEIFKVPAKSNDPNQRSS